MIVKSHQLLVFALIFTFLSCKEEEIEKHKKESDDIKIEFEITHFYDFEFDDLGIKRGKTFYDERDGQYYKTIKIGSLLWMVDNFNYEVPLSWKHNELEKNNKKNYGRLYTWNSAHKAIPNGWRLPTNFEWSQFVHELSRINNKLKNKPRYNKKGKRIRSFYDYFKLGGYRNAEGVFQSFGYSSYYWTSTPKQWDTRLARFRYSGSNKIGKSDFYTSNAFSILLVREI